MVSYSHLNSRNTFFIITALMILLLPVEAPAGPTDPVYRLPPQILVDIIDAPPTPEISLGPNLEWLLVMQHPNLVSIEELAERELRLAR